MPDYSANIKKIKQEMPDVSDVDVQPAGPIARFFSKAGSRATANPFTGNVTYYPQQMEAEGLSPEAINNVFTHELTHSRQIQNTPLLQRFANVGRSLLPGFLGGDESYYERPREMEAYQAERDRTARLGLRNIPDPMTGARDIELPSPVNLSKRQAMFDRLRGTRTGG
jgi:hypothetical protein